MFLTFECTLFVNNGSITSPNEGLSPSDQGRQRRESLGTRLLKINA